MDPVRPNLGVRPCAVCGVEVDPLRAPYVAMYGNVPVALCSAACRDRFAAGERIRASKLLTPPTAQPAPPPRPPSRVGDVHLPLSPLALALGALLFSPFAAAKWAAVVTTLLLLGAALDLSLRAQRLCVPKAALPIAGLGVSLVALGAYPQVEEAGAWALITAALAGVAVACRFTLWVLQQEPLEREAEAFPELLGRDLEPIEAERIAAAFRGRVREQLAASTRASLVSVRLGVAVVLVVAAVLAFFSQVASETLSVVGAVFVSLPLLAPLATTARAQLFVGLRAAARGVYFDGPRALERFGQVAHVIFPAHGTVTLSEAELAYVRRLDDAYDEDELLALVTSAEAAAGAHPIALACRAACQRRGLEVPLARRARALEGRGVVSLSVSGEDVVVGHRALLLAEGVSVARADAAASEIESSGDTAVFVAVSGRVRGVLAFRYPEREGVRETVERLQSLDVDATLLSGDHHQTAEAIAQSLGVPHVRAELLPSEKLTELARIQENAEPVVVVEHVDSETTLLPAARLSVRLGGAGRVPGRGAATLEGDPRLAAEALALARRLRRSMIASGVVIAVAGLPTLILAALFDLSPALAALVPLCVEAFVHPTGARAT